MLSGHNANTMLIKTSVKVKVKTVRSTVVLCGHLHAQRLGNKIACVSSFEVDVLCNRYINVTKQFKNNEITQINQTV